MVYLMNRANRYRRTISPRDSKYKNASLLKYSIKTNDTKTDKVTEDCDISSHTYDKNLGLFGAINKF